MNVCDSPRLAVRAAAVVGADYAGVDLLPSSDGQVFVLEVNGIPGWRGLQRALGVDVADAIVDHLARRVEEAEAAEKASSQRPQGSRGTQRSICISAPLRSPR